MVKKVQIFKTLGIEVAQPHTGPGVNACSLASLPGPDVPLGFIVTYSTVGQNILNSLAISALELSDL